MHESAFQRWRGRGVAAVSTERARALVGTCAVEDEAFRMTGSVRKSDDRPGQRRERGMHSLGVSIASRATVVFRSGQFFH